MTSLLERLNRLRFQRAVRAIRQTPPIRPGERPFAALSMVRRTDVLPYLLAIKSFAQHTRPERIILIADPSLTADDLGLIRRHAPAVEILPAERFRHPALPIGGTWERLAAIAALNADCSIVQLDADTVTFAEPEEVVRAACEGRTFVLRAKRGVEIVDLEAAAAEGRARLAQSQHIQVAVEARLTELPAPERFRYARGCSGFTGFGRGALSPEKLQLVSGQMRTLHGERWDEWGTEQVTSNLLAASTPGAFLLPHPRYCNADPAIEATVFSHYIGYARFRTRDYEKRARQTARHLRSAPAA